MCPGLILHRKGHHFMVIVPYTGIQVVLHLENQCYLIVGTFYLLAVLGIKRILAVLVIRNKNLSSFILPLSQLQVTNICGPEHCDGFLPIIHNIFITTNGLPLSCDSCV